MSVVQILGAVSIPVMAAAVIGAGRWIIRAIGREVRTVVREMVEPELRAIHDRIDRHMDEEEEDIKLLIEVLQQVAGIDADAVMGRMERLRPITA
jgi:hypothetical protein